MGNGSALKVEPDLFKFGHDFSKVQISKDTAAERIALLLQSRQPWLWGAKREAAQEEVEIAVPNKALPRSTDAWH